MKRITIFVTTQGMYSAWIFCLETNPHSLNGDHATPELIKLSHDLIYYSTIWCWYHR